MFNLLPSTFDAWALTVLIFLPVAAALLIAILPRGLSKPLALATAALEFVLALHLWAHWDWNASGFQFEQQALWMPNFGINYHLGVDGFSALPILMTAFLTPLVILGAWREMNQRGKEFAVCLLLLEGAVVGVFAALDLILFYVFWEAVLIPMYLLIGVWGGPSRVYAAIKFFLYTMAGSVLMWIALLYIYYQQPVAARSFDYAAMQTMAQIINTRFPDVALWLFAAFAIIFAIKVPMFPLHTWLPDAHFAAPTATSIMLASVLFNMGTYGFVRLAIPFFPVAALIAAPLMIGLAIISIIYGGMVALQQTELKRFLAYASVSHLGFVVLGIFAGWVALNATSTNAAMEALIKNGGQIALSGATLQVLNHGVIECALFLLVGILAERRGTRDIAAFGGLAQVMPRYTVLFWVAVFAAVGLPGLNGFVGEYLILQGSMAANFWYAAWGATGVVLGAVYMLRMFRSVMFGELTHEENKTLRDVSSREYFVLTAVLAMTVWIGVAPKQLLDFINDPVQQIADLGRKGTPAPAPILDPATRGPEQPQ